MRSSTLVRFLSRQTPRWLFVLLLVLLVLASLNYVYMPEVVSTIWHLMYGRFARFETWEIPVPRGWFAYTADQDGAGLILLRMQRLYVRRKAALVFVHSFHRREINRFRYEKWRQAEEKQLSQRGHHLVAERTARLLGQEAFCLEFALVKDPTDLEATCHIPAQSLSITFRGGPEHMQDFYFIAHGMRRRVHQD